MNRLIALKHKADESLVSNASANDGYETANDETMGNASVSMYFSMNESDMSLDKTIEAQPHQQIANDPSSSPSFSNKKLRIVLTPIADSANYMSPKKNLINGKRNQTTSTPLKGATAVIVKAAAAPDDDDEEENEENSPNSSVATARKVIIIKADVVNSATKKSPSKTPAKELSGIEMMDTSQTIEEAKYASDIIDSIEITEFKASDAAVVATVDVPAPADTNTKSTQADAVVAEKPATAQRSSLSAAFRRNAWAGAALSTIVEKSSASALSQGSTSTDAGPSRRRSVRRRSVVAAPQVSSQRRQSLKTITHHPASSQRKSIGRPLVLSVLAAANPAGAAAVASGPVTRRRSMAAVVVAAVAASNGSKNAVDSTINATTGAHAAAAAAPPVARVNTRRSMAAATKPATPRRAVIASTAAAVLAQNPTRRRASLKPMTPVRRIATLAVTAQRPRTPIRVPQPPQQQQPAALRRRSVMTAPAALPPAFSFACSACDKTFLQQSRLAAHMRTHATTAAPTISSQHQCQHCDKTFGKPQALSTHLLEHCTKIASGERRKLLQQNDRKGSSAAATTTQRSKVSAGSQSNVSRNMSPSRAHRGVFQTPNKTIKCNVCLKQFGDPVSFALHGETHRK